MPHNPNEGKTAAQITAEAPKPLRDNPADKTPAQHAADAQRLLYEDPKAFLEKFSTKMHTGTFQPTNRVDDPNVGKMVFSIAKDTGAGAENAQLRVGSDGRASAVKANMRSPTNTPLGPHEFEVNVVNIPVQPVTQGRFDTVHLPKEGGPSIVITTNISACALAVVPSKDGSYEAVHLQPMGAKNGHEVHDAIMNKAVPGQVVLGKRDVEHTTANILGVRNDQGDWKFYAQHVKDDHIVRVEELEPKKLRRGGEERNVRVDGPDVAAQLIADSVNVPLPDRLKGHKAEVKDLKEGEIVQGLVMQCDPAGKTIVRDDSKKNVPENERPLKAYPSGGNTANTGQEVHVGWEQKKNGKVPDVTYAPSVLRDLHAQCPGAASQVLAPPPKAPSRGLFH